jgi:hypothetical protein
MWASIRTASPTFDEPYHIVRSYVYLRTGDLALVAQGGHPPFSNLLSVSPLLLRSDIALPPHQAGWPGVGSLKDLFRVADEFLWRIGNDAESIVQWSRLAMACLSVLLAGLVFHWARQLYGVQAGLLALLLYAFDPNMIAHSSVVTTDLGAAFFIFASVYCLWCFCRRPSWGRLVWTGVSFGLAQASKFSALFLAPIFLALLAIWVTGRREPFPGFRLPGWKHVAGRPRVRRAWLVLGPFCFVLVLGFLVLWAVYGFRISTLLPHEATHPLLDRLLPLDNPSIRRVVYAVAESFPVPAPAYFADLAWLGRYIRAGHPSFILGTRGVTGWWFYFPVAFVIKTPIPLLVLLSAATCLSIRHREDLHEEYFLLVSMVLLFASSMFSSIDIGYRNILPVLPFGFVYASKMATWVRGHLAQLTVLVLCLWCVVGTVIIHPHYLAYFNEIIGGPDNGYKYLVDSNLDWGQDLKALKQYMDVRGINEVYLSYFGTADPAYYGIRYRPLPDVPPGDDAALAYYAISATSLQGVYAQEREASHWLARYEPVAKLGYSIFVYRLPQ